MSDSERLYKILKVCLSDEQTTTKLKSGLFLINVQLLGCQLSSLNSSSELILACHVRVGKLARSEYHVMLL